MEDTAWLWNRDSRLDARSGPSELKYVVSILICSRDQVNMCQ